VRLVAFREAWRSKQPDWFNAPVPSFGPVEARLLIVGLAPGLQGANRTGRPFTGDYAGDLLYQTLIDHGFAAGTYAARPDDGLTLPDARTTNAVRCVPPENKPTGREITHCRTCLRATIAEMPILRRSSLSAGSLTTPPPWRSRRVSALKFSHGATHEVEKLTVFDSYHCSRYNTNTGVLTTGMFRTVFAAVRCYLDARSHSATTPALASGGKTG
jgi:uracil-DNA glycosylase family 4